MVPSQSAYISRQSKLAQKLRDSQCATLVLNPGPSLAYFTGLRFHLMERPVLAFFFSDQSPAIVLPELETAKVARLPYPMQIFTYGEDPSSWVLAFQSAIQATGLRSKDRVGLEPRQIRFLELDLLQKTSYQFEFSSGEEIITSIRIMKDEDEISNIRKAVEIAQNALLATLPTIKPGISEKDIAAELTLQLLRGGSEPEMPFTPIVSAGPNSANPHATPSARKLHPGDCLVIDWGATYEGYISDITRTFAIGQLDPEMRRIGQIVADANAAGRAAAAPETPAEQVDSAARRVIDAAGYGAYFIHRTGHGIGLDGHEEPYIRAGNTQPLKPGMTFTVEPGIYLPDRNGVRIEDNIVITPDGAECLTDLPREITELG